MIINLQLFAEPVRGKKIVYPIRVKENAATENATVLAFVTENERTKSKDSDTTETKDGPIRTPGALEQEVSFTTLLPKGDERIDGLEDALDNDKLVQVWEVNLEEPVQTANKYKGRYMEGYITELNHTSSAEDNVEISITVAINGPGVSGEVTITSDQYEEAMYAFQDTPKTGA